MNNVVEILKAARAVIADPVNWTQEHYAKDSDGAHVSEEAMGAATCFCSVGAVAKASNARIADVEKGAAVRLLSKAIGGTNCDIVEYNDEHTHEEVLAAFDKAIELAQTELVVTNLETLLAAVEAFPETNLNLSTYKVEDTECGTLYCVAGLAATLPHFNAQGMRYDSSKFGHSILIGDAGGHIGRDRCVDPMFGQGAWYNLFATFGHGLRDEEIGAYVNNDRYTRAMTDKQLAIARLKLQIEAVKGAA